MDDALCKAISDFENKKSVQVAGLKECKDLAVQAVGVPGEAKPIYSVNCFIRFLVIPINVTPTLFISFKSKLVHLY